MHNQLIQNGRQLRIVVFSEILTLKIHFQNSILKKEKNLIFAPRWSRSSTDRMGVSGTSDSGSIPLGTTRPHRLLLINRLWGLFF